MARDRLRALIEHANTRHGIVTRRWAMGAGIDPTTIRSWSQSGILISVLPGVLRLAGRPENRVSRIQAALDYVGGDALVSRSTAANLHGIQFRPDDERVHLTNGVRSSPFPDWIVLHRTIRQPAHHVTQSEGMRCSTIERSIVDVASECTSARPLRWLVTEAMRRKLCTATSLRDVATEMRRARGRRTLLTILDELSPLTAATRSQLELKFLSVVEPAGLRPTAMNHPVVDAAGVTRFLDAVYLPQMLPIELDSAQWHRLRTDQHDDHRRANAIFLVGWQAPLRYTWWDLTERPGRVIDQIRQALAASPPR